MLNHRLAIFNYRHLRCAFCFGFVYLLALAGIVVTSVLTAPLGARLAHALPVNQLKRIFAVFLYVIATKMTWGLISK